MQRKTTTAKSKEFTISAVELPRLGMGIMVRALKVVDTAKKGKITIRLEKQLLFCSNVGVNPFFSCGQKNTHTHYKV